MEEHGEKQEAKYNLIDFLAPDIQYWRERGYDYLEVEFWSVPFIDDQYAGPIPAWKKSPQRFRIPLRDQSPGSIPMQSSNRPSPPDAGR